VQTEENRWSGGTGGCETPVASSSNCLLRTVGLLLSCLGILMKQEFFAKAQENLKAAELLFENGLYNATANRAYYAALHAAIAALADIGISVTVSERISHEATHSNFTTELIPRRKKYASFLKSYLVDLQSVRNDADYKTKNVSKKVASKQLKQAKEFVETVKKVIKV
jgi:uncharacterized protein (UPF0332 family)